MGEFTGVVLGFPTVVFTGCLVAVVAFWGLVLVGGADAHGPWHHHGLAGGHGGTGGHGGSGGYGGHGVGGRHDLAAPGGGSGDGHAHGGSGGLLAAAGLGGVPVTVVLSLLVAVSWFLSLAGSAALRSATGPAAPVRVLLYAAVVAAALAGAWCATWVLVRPLRRLFPDVRPPSRADFVGRVCVVRTGAVTDRFGQAEVAAADGSTAVVQVRQHGSDAFTAGSTALLYDYDPEGEFFWVAPFDAPTDAPFDTFTT
ncbi:MAG: hypothetical protein HOY69_29005 [Streptomyces sp.]|nr:hypothetical protein [Streptomyces sp.]